MPTLARPEVDVLDGLTTAIIVDQERMGGNARSTVGTATDANAMLRILFSRLGQPHIGRPTRSPSTSPRSGRAVRSRSSAATRQDRSGRPSPAPAACAALRGPGLGHRLRPVRAVRRQQVAQRGCAHDPRLQHGRLVRPHLPRLRLLRPGQADPQVHQEGAPRPALQGADQDQGRGHQPHLRGPDPEIQKSMLSKDVDALQPHIRAFVERAVTFTTCPDCGGTRLSEAARSSKIAGVNIADACAMQISDLAEWVRGLDEPSVAPLLAGAAAHARLVRRDRAGLPLARPAVGHAVGRRGAAHQDDPPPRLVAHRRDLRLRRADDRAAPPRHPADERPAAAAARQGQHRAGRRAQAGGDRIADHVVDLGPRAGTEGGQVVFEGTVEGCGPAARSPGSTSTTAPP